MAGRGTAKRYSTEQEDRFALAYNGRRSRSSGGAAHDAGDVRSCCCLCENKIRVPTQTYPKSISLKLEDFEKIASEAWAEGKIPMMGLSIINPDSVLADRRTGAIDFVVYLVNDDSARECFCE